MTDLKPDLAPVDPLSLPSCAPETPLEALEWLGGTVEEVVEGLRVRGIKGQRDKGADSCPIACYLNQWFTRAHVCSTLILTWESGPQMSPPVIGEFVRRWDKREFPDLIA